MDKLKNKFAIGCLVQFYEIELVEEYINSLKISFVLFTIEKFEIILLTLELFNMFCIEELKLLISKLFSFKINSELTGFCVVKAFLYIFNGSSTHIYTPILDTVTPLISLFIPHNLLQFVSIENTDDNINKNISILLIILDNRV